LNARRAPRPETRVDLTFNSPERNNIETGKQRLPHHARSLCLWARPRRTPVKRAAIDPIMMTAGTVPILIAAPFLLIWFGVGRASAVSLVAFYVVVILYVSPQRAALNLDPIYENSALTLGAGKQQRLRDILIPATVPEILRGFRIALAGSFGLEAVAELLGSQSGIGKVLEVLAAATDRQGILATLLVLGVAAILPDALAAAVIARFAAWNFAAR
jgi:ABC-type nitrate/sulfonate/bicarbonate transport system permease component